MLDVVRAHPPPEPAPTSDQEDSTQRWPQLGRIAERRVQSTAQIDRPTGFRPNQSTAFAATWDTRSMGGIHGGGNCSRVGGVKLLQETIHIFARL